MATPDEKPLSAAEQVDQKLAQLAMRKITAGETPTAREQAALKRHQSLSEERACWQHYKSIPPKHWIQMVESEGGRLQNHQLKRVAETYGLPLDTNPINLPKVVAALHALLAQHWRTFSAKISVEAPSSALEEYRRLKAERERIALAKERGTVVELSQLDIGLSQFVMVFRQGFKQCQDEFGSGPVELMSQVYEEALARLDAVLAYGDSAGEEIPDEPGSEAEPGQTDDTSTDEGMG